MKKTIIAVLLLIPSLAFCQQKPKLTDSARLNNCIAANTSHFTFNGRQPTGDGWTALENLFAQNQFVAWGEYHNSPLLSQLTAYALASASKTGYKTWCVETGAFAAAELKRISRCKNPTDTILKLYKESYPQIGTFPFFSTADDAGMLLAANKFHYDIWGIDQEFQMSFSYCIDRIYNAQSNRIKQRYSAVRDSLKATWWYPDTQLLDSLKRAIPQKNYRDLIDAIKASKEIYRYGDNEARAALMKRNFFKYYDAAGHNEKVFLKMGSNHLAKGLNLQTRLFDIGNALYELAQRNNTGFANVYIMARYTTEDGKLIDDLYANAPENPKVFSRLYDKDKWVLVDIRPLRIKMKYDGTITKDTYQLIEKYDYVLISPELMK